MSAPAATNDTDYDVAIVGAGLQGCSAALQLAARGRRVAVVEKDHPARHASGVNAGGVRSLWRHPAEVPLALASLEIWREIEALVGDDCGYRGDGQLKIAESEADMARLEARAAEMRALGFEHEGLVGRNALRALVPEVAGHCVGGLHASDEGSANPFRTSWAFHRRARALGVAFVIGEPVTGIERDGASWRMATPVRTLRAEVLINCAGAWGDRIADMIGDAVPLEPVALTMMVTGRVGSFLEPVCGVVSRKLSCKQLANGTVLVGGGHRGVADRTRNLARPVMRELAISARTVSEVFPVLRRAPLVRSWAGIEGVTPDALPVLGPSPAAPDAFHAFGFSAHGFALGPVVGRILAELVVDGRSELPIAPFSPGRFGSPQPSAAAEIITPASAP